MARPWTLPVVLTGVFITVLDFFIVNVAIPSMQEDLHAGSAAVQWIVAGYGLAYGSGLVLGGRLGDVVGRRRMFMIGLAVFTLASVACGLAPTAGALIAARVVQGVAAAALSPQVLAIIRTSYQGPVQARAVNAYGLTAGMAAVFGQLIGGVLIQADVFGLGWRACFLINVPIGVVALAVAGRAIPESRQTGAAKLDFGGAVLVTGAMVTTLLPLIEGRAEGWPLWTWLSFAATVGLLVAYARRGHEAPLVNLGLFRERAFAAGLLTQLAFSMGMAAYFLIFALYTQEGRGLDSLQAGLFFMPIGVGYLAASLLAPRLVRRYGRQVIAVGGLTRALGLATLSLAVGWHMPVAWLVPILALDGVGMGLAFAPIMGTVLARVAPQHAGAAAGLLTTTQQVGGAIGVGLIGIVFYGDVGGGVPHAFQSGLVFLIVVMLGVAALVQTLPKAQGPARGGAVRVPEADAVRREVLHSGTNRSAVGGP
jgi:EmrB/QacA subfamily drug resistance transporter